MSDLYLVSRKTTLVAIDLQNAIMGISAAPYPATHVVQRNRKIADELRARVFYDPKTGAHRGRDEINRVAGAIRASHPDFQYQPIAEPEELGNAGRVEWVSRRPGEAPAYAGADFIIARDSRIAALYLFFDNLP